MSFLSYLLGTHEISDWCSNAKLAAARTLNVTAHEIIKQIDKEIRDVGLWNGLTEPDKIIDERVAPLVREAAALAARMIVDNVNKDLPENAGYRAVWTDTSPHRASRSSQFEGSSDVAAAAVPVATGLAVAAAVPSAAITTTTSLFGLIAVSTVSWPIVIAGSVIAATGIGIGALQGAKLSDKTQTRLRDKAAQYVKNELLTGASKSSSILQQLEAEFDRVAKENKRIW